MSDHQTMPARADTAIREYKNLITWITARGGEIGLHFEGEGGECSLSFIGRDAPSAELHGDLAERIIALTGACLTAEFGNWAEGAGAIGSVRIDRDGMWITGDSREEDWGWDRYFDEDGLEEIAWDLDTVAAPV